MNNKEMKQMVQHKMIDIVVVGGDEFHLMYNCNLRREIWLDESEDVVKMSEIKKKLTDRGHLEYVGAKVKLVCLEGA